MNKKINGYLFGRHETIKLGARLLLVSGIEIKDDDHALDLAQELARRYLDRGWRDMILRTSGGTRYHVTYHTVRIR